MNPLLPALAAALLATYALAAPKPPVIEIAQPWSRPAVAGTNGVGYMTLVNRGGAPDALVGARSPLARKVEIHQASMAGGVMSMQRQDRVAVPPGASVAFAPGGRHLMFVGLAKTLKPGDALPATLSFASGARVTVTFAVGSGMSAPDAAHKHH